MAKNPVAWFEIYVQDMERARTFYEIVLDLKLDEMPMPGVDMCAFPMERDGAGAAGALCRMDGFPSGSGNSTLVYFSCEDCAVEAGRVADAGGRVEKPKESIGEWGFIAIATDTEGNTFGLHSLT